MKRLERGWLPAPHMELIERWVLATLFAPGMPRRLMLLIPPGHGKSTYVSKYLPARFLDWFPWAWVVLTSYEASFARKWGRKARDLIAENPREFRIRISDEQSAGSDWEVKLRYRTEAGRDGGGMSTAGTGGPITGRRANLFLIDDPIKNYEEAESETYRKKAWDWYTGTVRDRLEPDAAIVMVMQRWHEDDLAGRIIERMEEGGEAWSVLRLPAFAEEGDPLGREVGAALWPGRFDHDAIEDLATAMGPYKFNAKFQQSPQPPEGNLIKRSMFRYFAEMEGFYELYGDGADVKRIPKDHCWTVQTCDPAATEKDQSHYFVLETWIITPDNDALLYDVLREKAETTKHKPMVRAAYKRYRPLLQGVENKTFGLNIIQELVKEGLPVKPIDVDGSKFARALPLQARYNVGAVYHRIGAPWLTDYEDEVVKFPKGTHDDQVDAASQMPVILAEYKPPSAEHIGTSGKKRISSRVNY